MKGLVIENVYEKSQEKADLFNHVYVFTYICELHMCLLSKSNEQSLKSVE